jgi:putative DNA primase/helicase
VRPHLALIQQKRPAARRSNGPRSQTKFSRLFSPPHPSRQRTPSPRAFLSKITNGNAELSEYLARMAGYCLTGSTNEHALFFCYGTGANGKTTLVNAITGCIGDYHRTAPIETFTQSHNDRHPTELAALRGARLVTAVETEEGRRWAESKIKALTGGDAIAARFMRQDFFEYVPQFKLLIAGNHKPGLRSVDEAIRRRFNLVPFTVTIPPEERDEGLPEKLKAELPGILAWMIRGCSRMAPAPRRRTQHRHSRNSSLSGSGGRA